MANFAVISEGVVNNIIIADTQEIAIEVTGHLCVEYETTSNVGIGTKYENGEFIIPPLVQPPMEE